MNKRVKKESVKVYISLHHSPQGWCIDRRSVTGKLYGCSGRFDRPNHPILRLELDILQKKSPNAEVEYVIPPDVIATITAK